MAITPCAGLPNTTNRRRMTNHHKSETCQSLSVLPCLTVSEALRSSAILLLELVVHPHGRSHLQSAKHKVNNAAVVGVEYVHGVDTSEEKFSGLDFDQRLEWVWTNVRESDDAAKKGVQTNYYGTKHVIEALLPLLQSSSEGKIVNVSSDLGLLRLISNEEVRQELDDVDSLTEERLDELLDKFLKDFEAGALEAKGWPIRFSAYKVAKAAMNSYRRILARRHPALHVNCAHPGYVKTDMTMNSGLLTPEEGARNVV